MVALKSLLGTSPQYVHRFIQILEKRGSDRHLEVNGIAALCQVIILGPSSDSNVCVSVYVCMCVAV